jgi:hypothetical protein
MDIAEGAGRGPIEAMTFSKGIRACWRLRQFKGLQNSTPPQQATLVLQDYQRLIAESMKLDRKA